LRTLRSASRLPATTECDGAAATEVVALTDEELGDESDAGVEPLDAWDETAGVEPLDAEDEDAALDELEDEWEDEEAYGGGA
jgi:hypothetical protein